MARIWNKHKQSNTPLKRKVFVAMSGGVDSSVAAALLHERGFDVTGVFIKSWQPPFLTCSWRDERDDAMRVAARLGVPFLTVDLSEVYERDVVADLIEGYRAGRTPNPDILCNERIKFGAFFDYAMKQGADFIATGHYARLRREFPISKSQFPKIEVRLLNAFDEEKDQTYFLWKVPARVFEHVLFPIGDHRKSDVRAIAKNLGLHTADKKDSQGVCMLGELSMREFLSHYIEKEQGIVVSASGEAIGTHDGARFLTIGERRGFSVSAREPNARPLYVVEKDVAANVITVAPRHERGGRTEVRIESVNWIGDAPEAGRPYGARYRHRQELVPATVRTDPADEYAEFVVQFDNPEAGIANGQSLVLYDGERCFGGGIISG